MAQVNVHSTVWKMDINFEIGQRLHLQCYWCFKRWALIMKFDDMCIPCCHPKCLGQCPADPHFHRNEPMPLTQQILSLTTVIKIHNYCLSHLSALLWLCFLHIVPNTFPFTNPGYSLSEQREALLLPFDWIAPLCMHEDGKQAAACLCLQPNVLTAL